MIAIVIPCYKVKQHINRVINNIPSNVDLIILVDDCCPDGSIDDIREDSRIAKIKRKINGGVGAAFIDGMLYARKTNASIVVKIDGDDQMDLNYLESFINPIKNKKADFCKGNRFYIPRSLNSMPIIRLIGNMALSFISKASSGYWNVMDPTNGYFAINAKVIDILPIEKIEKRYFFESDLLYNLRLVNAVVRDIPILSRYGDEVSNLSIINTIFTFPEKYLKRLMKRIIYLYFIRDFNIGSIYLMSSILFFVFSLVYGLSYWIYNAHMKVYTPVGTIMIATVSMLFAFQLFLAFLNFDIMNIPRNSLSELGVFDESRPTGDNC